MPPPIDAAALAGTWVRSHEEDTDDCAVYRPAGFAFPPARGRGGFTLNADGSATEFGPGAADQPVSGHARWALGGGDCLEIFSAGAKSPPRVLNITSHQPDKLLISKKKP